MTVVGQLDKHSLAYFVSTYPVVIPNDCAMEWMGLNDALEPSHAGWDLHPDPISLSLPSPL